MGKTALIHNNLAPNCTNITATNMDPDFPVENLLINCPADKFITTANSTEIILNYSQAVVFEVVSFVAHNFPNNAVIQLFLSNDEFQNWDFYEMTSISPEIEFLSVSGNHKDIKVIINSTGIIKIGQLYIGEYTEITENAVFEIIRTPVETSEVITNDYRQKLKSIKSLIWQVRLKFEYIDTLSYKNLVKILFENEAVILIVDTDSKEAYQGASKSLPPGTESIAGNAFDINFEQNPYLYNPEVA